MAKGWFGNSQGHAKAGRLGGLAKARNTKPTPYKGTIATPHKRRRVTGVEYAEYGKGRAKDRYYMGRGPGGRTR
jgi:hypothetical protein